MLLATALALGAAILHASWNLVVKASGDRLVAMWAQGLFGAIVALPLLFATGLPSSVAWPFLGVSILLHFTYALVLAAAYDRADLSVVYPIARGSAPLLTAVGGALFLTDILSPAGYVGVVVAVAGLLLIGRRGRWQRGVGWALGTAGIISSYTLVDTAGVRAGGNPVGYVIVLLAVSGAMLTIPVIATRGRAGVATAVRAAPWHHLFAGVASLGAYALVLVAVRLAPVAYVATLRESSIVLGALGGWLLLHETLGARRTVGAVVVAAGIAFLVASGL